MDLVYQLWEKPWEDGAVKWQAEPEMAYDPSKIYKTDFDGEFHRYFLVHLHFTRAAIRTLEIPNPERLANSDF
jgi:hypothetical protein